MANPTPATGKDGDHIDGLLRIVSNRCRNLRKAIEKANAHEKSKESGKELNSEQEQSIEMKAVRIAQLHELEEILRKQEALVTPPKLSKRAAKRLQKVKKHNSNFGSVSDAGSDAPKANGMAAAAEGSNSLPGRQTEKQQSEKLSDAHTSTDGDTLERAIADAPPGGDTASDERAQLAQLSASLAQLQEASRGHAHALRQASTVAAGAVLEMAHVVTFLTAAGGRDCVRAVFERSAVGGGMRVTDMDIEILLYFYRMLTSPNGEVPHAQAVATSVAHFEAYLEYSDREPFQGTTYRQLRDVVAAIAASPPLARRRQAHMGALPPEGRMGDAGRMGDMGRGKVDERGLQQTAMMHEAAVMRSHF